MYYQGSYRSPLGVLGLVCDEEALAALWFPTQAAFSGDAQWMPEHPVLVACYQWLDGYFSGRAMEPLPVHPRGTPFQMLMWQLLAEVPWGETTTYGTLAKAAARRLGKNRMSAQAVGGAVGRNPIAIVLPCHRVLGVGGELTGYTGGLDIKKALLTVEGWR